MFAGICTYRSNGAIAARSAGGSGTDSGRASNVNVLPPKMAKVAPSRSKIWSICARNASKNGSKSANADTRLPIQAANSAGELRKASGRTTSPTGYPAASRSASRNSVPTRSASVRADGNRSVNPWRAAARRKCTSSSVYPFPPRQTNTPAARFHETSRAAVSVCPASQSVSCGDDGAAASSRSSIGAAESSKNRW